MTAAYEARESIVSRKRELAFQFSAAVTEFKRDFKFGYLISLTRS